jgi:1,2-diacylglycerol 3-alpha-glucosyltransferase
VNGLFDWAVAGGKAHVQYLEQLGFPSDRIAHFYDVVDNAFFHERCRALRKAYRAADFDLPERYFLYVGRLSPEKNITGLIEAYVRYRECGGTWSLVIVGDGPQAAQAREMAATKEFSLDIYFPGLRTTSELPQYYAFAGAFVLPSIREPWGLVVNEAMAAGLPVIVSQLCGCAEDLVLQGENGFSFDPVGSHGLTGCMLALGELTPEERSRMGRRSAEIIARFSPEAWGQEIARIASY